MEPETCSGHWAYVYEWKYLIIFQKKYCLNHSCVTSWRLIKQREKIPKSEWAKFASAQIGNPRNLPIALSLMISSLSS